MQWMNRFLINYCVYLTRGSSPVFAATNKPILITTNTSGNVMYFFGKNSVFEKLYFFIIEKINTNKMLSAINCYSPSLFIIFLATILPDSIARITVAAPLTTSPPA